MKTTTIRFKLGSARQTWDVPRGFGAEYLRAIRDDLGLAAQPNPGAIIDVIQDTLALAGYAATREQIADWPLRKRVEARVYALREHLCASDCGLPRHPKLAWLPEPWSGSRGGFAPTEVPR